MKKVLIIALMVIISFAQTHAPVAKAVLPAFACDSFDVFDITDGGAFLGSGLFGGPDIPRGHTIQIVCIEGLPGAGVWELFDTASAPLAFTQIDPTTIEYTVSSSGLETTNQVVVHPAGPGFDADTTMNLIDPPPPPNTAPVINTPINQTSTEGDVINLVFTVTDVDGDSVAVNVTNLPTGLSAGVVVAVGTTTVTISGTIAGTASATSPYTVSMDADDSAGGTPSDTFSWTVAAAPSGINPIARDSIINNLPRNLLGSFYAEQLDQSINACVLFNSAEPGKNVKSFRFNVNLTEAQDLAMITQVQMANSEQGTIEPIGNGSYLVTLNNPTGDEDICISVSLSVRKNSTSESQSPSLQDLSGAMVMNANAQQVELNIKDLVLENGEKMPGTAEEEIIMNPVYKIIPLSIFAILLCAGLFFTKRRCAVALKN
jgi:hypothetical protein